MLNYFNKLPEMFQMSIFWAMITVLLFLGSFKDKILLGFVLYCLFFTLITLLIGLKEYFFDRKQK